MHNALVDPFIGVAFHTGRAEYASLPAVFEHAFVGSIADFPALRPHQRHAWHAFLCQLGALAVLRGELDAPPATADGWRAALRTLTPDFPDDEPWHLVSPLDKPALLQAVVGPVDAFKSLMSPDELDVLVTSKSHDVKGVRMATAQAQDWLFALVTLQTSEGFLGAGNYGVARMNGGFSNRPGLSLAPPGGVGAHIARDMKRLIELRRDGAPDALDYRLKDFDETGIALTWLEPWDGATSLNPRKLDPYFIEICRRVRLVVEDGRLRARAGGSKSARIDFGKDAAGVTGDPWTPVETDAKGAKALTVDARGFAYKRLSNILFGRGFQIAPLQNLFAGDAGESAHSLVARALARGQGKTEGLHERRIPVSPKVLGVFTRTGDKSAIGEVSQARIEQAGKVASALRFGLMTLFQNGPESVAQRDPSSTRHAEPFLDLFETEVDRDFFEHLFTEFEEDSAADRTAARAAWLAVLKSRAERVLEVAEAGAPRSTLRRYRAGVRARSALNGAFYKALGDYFPQEATHDHHTPG